MSLDLSQYLLYCLAVVVLIATPGPVMLLVASAGLSGGYRKALATIFGTNLASLILIVVSVLVLKGILNIDPIWFNWVKILGCLYIAYLGIAILREASQGAQDPISTTNSTQNVLGGGFKQGFWVAISNPKDIVFFASFFPQFITVLGDMNQSLSLLTLTWIVLDFATLSLVYLGFNRLSGSRFYAKTLAACGAILVLVALYGILSSLF